MTPKRGPKCKRVGHDNAQRENHRRKSRKHGKRCATRKRFALEGYLRATQTHPVPNFRPAYLPHKGQRAVTR
eukprot:scaffold4810_cov63-Phaeocystis_antarctica.AAC.1